MEADLQGEGIDLGDREFLRSRTWRWLKVRIEGLLAKPPSYIEVHTEKGYRIMAVQQTRLALALNPPDLRGGR